MAKQRILLPHNFADYDHRALDFVIRTFSHHPDIEITLFNAYQPLPDIATQVHQAPVLDKLKSNISALKKQLNNQEQSLKDAKQNLINYGFKEEQVNYIFKPRKKDTAAEIIDLATREKFDMVIINHKPGKVTRFFTGSVFQKVVNTLKNTAVCVVT
jgi:nucleotide-binding universal stress UspA family protein